MPASTYPPSVDALARRLAQQREFDRLPRTMLVDAVRSAVATAPSEAESTAVDLARLATRRLLTSVINGTGTLLHTNLGRSPRPLPTAVADRVRATTIELDLATGERGSRHGAVAELLVDLTGAEATVVVNNCAAGLVLVLAALAHGRGVVISRGELVEIGGGFRIPDIIEQSGCRLIEVGTTNRTRLADYQRAIESNDVAVVLKVHPSNYRITGFTEEVGIATLATLGLPVIGDLGTGLLDASTPWLADDGSATECGVDTPGAECAGVAERGCRRGHRVRRQAPGWTPIRPCSWAHRHRGDMCGTPAHASAPSGNARDGGPTGNPCGLWPQRRPLPPVLGAGHPVNR